MAAIGRARLRERAELLSCLGRHGTYGARPPPRSAPPTRAAGRGRGRPGTGPARPFGTVPARIGARHRRAGPASPKKCRVWAAHGTYGAMPPPQMRAPSAVWVSDTRVGPRGVPMQPLLRYVHRFGGGAVRTWCCAGRQRGRAACASAKHGLAVGSWRGAAVLPQPGQADRPCSWLT